MSWNVNPGQEELWLIGEAGLICRDAGRLEQAKDVFNGLRSLVPKSEVPEIFLGSVYVLEQAFDVAEQHYRRALEINPRSAWAWAQLTEASLLSGDKEAARAHAAKATELDPRGEYGKLARSWLQLAGVSSR